MINQKIQPYHLQKPAYVYLRQSTMGQVRLHQESTERQYALREKAIQLGWAPDNIRVLDGDLGLSGAQATHREDFKTVVADVSMNKVGAVFALEASRLSRSNADWHRLLELCSLTDTLILDEDGCYNPAEFNDQLLLGLKGTMSQAELHFIRARLQGGKLNKARKGELRFPLPVGYCCNDQKQTVLDPNQQVQGAIRLLFEKFRETGSAYAVVHYFGQQNIVFPKRAYGEAWAGKLLWGRLSHSRVLSVLKNPSYTGAYVYGRYRSQKQLSEDGTLQQSLKVQSLDDWQVLIKDHYDAYISWEDYLKNQTILESNCTHGDQRLCTGPAREGSALLQGLLICRECGRKITVRYLGDNGRRPFYQCSWKKREGLCAHECLSIRADAIEPAIIARVFEVVTPEQVDIALKTLDELQARHQRIEKQWQMRLAQAEYESQLAQRRYEEVDPANRLVAATLEKQWNETLINLEQVHHQIAEIKKDNALQLAVESKDRLMKLCSDFPTVWHAASTQPKNKKRILRHLIKDITVEKREKKILLHVRWQGNQTETIITDAPVKSYDKWRFSKETIDQVRTLSLQYDDKEIANHFNQQGIKTNKANPFTVGSIKWIRYKHKIPAPDLRRPGDLTVNDVMEKFTVSRHVVYYWIDRNIVDARKPKPGRPFLLSINASKEKELIEWVNNSKRIKGHSHP